MADAIKFEILEDGQIKFETSSISGANHASADDLLTMIEEAMGGERKVTPTKEKHVHKHLEKHIHA